MRTNLVINALCLIICFHIVCSTAAQVQPVSVSVLEDGNAASLAPGFLGLSYESSILLPQNGHYYFDSKDAALINTFKTLGIKNLRIGANAVDNPRIPIPRENDIDSLFAFARAAGVKVIYSFRLKNGDPADSGRLASYIATHYVDSLDCFAIGNEPNFYFKSYDAYFTEWKPHYGAILKAVPGAMFDGPSANNSFARNFARDLSKEGHLAMVSDHNYFLGSGRAGETNPPATRARFLSNDIHDYYKTVYRQLGAVLASNGIPYRMDELNSCYWGGAKDASDTYAATLWALDCTHWWAAHHLLGMNYHTGESVGRDETFGAANYAAFVHQADGSGFDIRPQSYAYLAFSQGAQGRPLEVKIQGAPSFNFNAYAYQDHNGTIFLTLINKSYGNNAQTALVSLQLPQDKNLLNCQRLDLAQEHQDVAAKSGISLGGASISPQGNWAANWEKAVIETSKPKVRVEAASATIFRFDQK